ncbi:MAG: tRNA-dihydrouridine synthase [Candidatus Zambryskibacteria bacterium]|nr:tRNA-dihydrouridine synthase [Candidatus Zambryskibacteria bacterium]
MLGFWGKLSKPIFVLAPMADVTDAAFRRIIAEVSKSASTRDGEPRRGGPDVMWTEFVSADGLALAPEAGRKKLLKSLEYSEAERPIVAQFFTSVPENMKKAAELARELGFDGVDINMGCPDKNVEKQGAGASLMKNVLLARELINAAKEGAGSLPVSVKTRIGYNKPELENWLPEILEEDVAVVTIHARTRKEMSKVSARWEFVKRAVEIRNASGKETLILGNGDVRNLKEARMRIEETGCNGIMFGRAIFGNPWLFADLDKPPSIEEKLRVLVKHIKLFEELLGEHKSFAVMKKHFKAYLSGIDGIGDLRVKLMNTNNASEVEAIISEFIKNRIIPV